MQKHILLLLLSAIVMAAYTHEAAEWGSNREEESIQVTESNKCLGLEEDEDLYEKIMNILKNQEVNPLPL